MIGFWFACVRHGPVARSFAPFCFPFRFQVMSQPRRSARLAARFQSARSSPPSLLRSQCRSTSRTRSPSPTVFPMTLSSLRSISSLPLLVSSVMGTSLSSGPLSRCVLQCCSPSIHLQCVTDLAHLPSQSVVCNSQSPSSLDFLHFQHLCCVRHVEAPAGECMICSSPQTFASSFSLPCCRQRIDYEGSVRPCLRGQCPFCTQDLVPVLSDPLPAASFEHLNIPIDFNALPAALPTVSCPQCSSSAARL